MVNAIVLLNVQSDLINQVAEELVALDGVSEVYSWPANTISWS